MLLKDILPIAVTTVTSLGGLKLIEYLLNLKNNRKQKTLETVKVKNDVLDDYVEGWKRLSDKQSTDLDRRDKRIYEMYKQLDDLRLKFSNLQTENTQLKIEIIELRFARCDDPYCTKRQPPRIFKD